MKYDEKTFITRYDDTKYAADKILDILFSWINIDSVIDIGCGVGTFLARLKKKANEVEYVGIDGDWVGNGMLVIPQECFFSVDLEKKLPEQLVKNYDLVISLEVAEHLSEQRADTFVEDLVSLGDFILFSAAIPYQGGIGHVNEQYLSYWQKKFAKYGYSLFDCIRPNIWNDEKIAWHYKQNAVVFYRTDKYEFEEIGNGIVDIIHPQFWENKNESLKLLEENLVVKYGRKIKKLVFSK